MILTESKLKKIIMEELEKVLNEVSLPSKVGDWDIEKEGESKPNAKDDRTSWTFSASKKGKRPFHRVTVIQKGDAKTYSVHGPEGTERNVAKDDLASAAKKVLG